MTAAYGEDLAYVHDAGFTSMARNAAPVVLAALRARRPHGLVVDLGCGSGVLAGELSAAGYDVLGIDISDAFIALARSRVPQAEFRVGSLVSAELPPCLAVTAIGECFNYLFDESQSLTTLAALMRRIHTALEPDGVLIFDIAEPGRVGPQPKHVHFAGPDWAVLVTAEEETASRLLTRHITTFRQRGELYRRSEEVHRLRLYTHDEMAGLLRDAGFDVETLTCYGEMRFPAGMTGFVAVKR